MSTDLELYDDDEIVEGQEPTLAEQQEEVTEQIEEVQSRLTEIAKGIVEIAAEPVGDSGTALVPSGSSAADAKRQLAVLRADAMRTQQRLEEKQSMMRSAQRELESLMSKQLALAEEALAPIERYVARLQEGVWMVNLYLGRDEEIVVLADGEAAPAKEPVAIRQMVLAMDEESALNTEDGGITANSIGSFDEWLVEDWAHVEQIAPEPKCVVALRPRRERRERRPSSHVGMGEDEADKKTYFLIRNGGRLYRTWTEFEVEDKLVPTRDEFSDFFFATERGWGSEKEHRIPIQPGTLAWERAEEEADARKRHYMRVGLILQGLVDRTTVFHPLPDQGIDFMNHEHGGVTWRFVNDAEASLTTGRQPFYEWLKEKNEQLHVGMRVVGTFHRFGAEGDEDLWKGRVYPSTAEAPPSGELLTLEDERDHGFVVRYKRKETIWRHAYHSGEAKVRASCVVLPTDRNIIPFDLVTVEEMQEYLGARLERHAYSNMFPLLKQAIHAKREEAELEAPFRTMLAGVLARENGVTVAEAEETVPSLVEWFKLANKNHRPLVGSEEEQGHAVRMIVAEHARRVKAKTADDSVVQKILAARSNAILVARKRDGKYLVLTPANNENVFVHEHTFTAKGEQLVGGRPWRLMPPLSSRVRWSIAYTTPRYESWNFAASADRHLTDPEIEQLGADMAERCKGKGEGLAAVALDTRKPKFLAWVLDKKYIQDRPYHAPEYRVLESAWVRRKGVACLEGVRTSHESAWTDQAKQWDTRRADGKPSQWRDTSRNLYNVLREDAKVEQRMAVIADAWKERTKRNHARDSKVRVLADSVEAAWKERNEKKLYAEFIIEYLDPALWEGHRKLMRKERFEYPHNHRERVGHNRTEPDAFLSLVMYAVDQGVDLDGMTVEAAASSHFPPAEWFAGSDEHEAEDWWDEERKTRRVSDLPTPDEIPDDLLQLKFKLGSFGGDDDYDYEEDDDDA